MAEKRWIREYLRPLVKSPGAHMIRDDVAILRPATIVTTDTLVEGVHFFPDDPVYTLAWKLVRVNVSDIVAKGGFPLEALLNISWPNRRPESDFALFSVALGNALADRDIALIGGDTVVHDGPLMLSMTLTGNVYSESGQPIRRTGAKVGDGIYVSGKIGWGAQGLSDRQAGLETEAARRYQVPEIPGEDVARLIATHATASMDVSDGMLIDLTALLDASAVGAELELERVPLCRPIAGTEDLLSLVTGGDDYQCLFTASELPILEAGLQVTKVGRIVAGTELSLLYRNQSIPLPQRLGFDH